MKQTPEKRAETRYPDPKEPMAERLGLIPDYKRRNDFREGFVTCIREEVEPLEAEVSRLKAEAEEMRKAFRFIKEIGEREPMTANDQTRAIYKMVKWANYGLASEGSTTLAPTNTEGNG